MGSLAINIVAVVAVFATLVGGGSCAPKKVPPGPNITTNYNLQWLPAKATWYGQPNGAGPDDNGGACGIKGTNLPPYSSMTACGNPPIFKDGLGCGSCYEVRCSSMPECSGQPITVFITDMNYEPFAPYHFDFSGTAFGRMAKPGLNDPLRHRGIMDIEFRRVRCKLPAQKIIFHTEKGSNPYYLAILVKSVSDDGDIVLMEIQNKQSPQWQPMNHSWGAIWRIDPAKPLNGPFSIRITSESGKKLIAPDVIPANWKAETFYYSNVQFF